MNFVPTCPSIPWSVVSLPSTCSRSLAIARSEIAMANRTALPLDEIHTKSAHPTLQNPAIHDGRRSAAILRGMWFRVTMPGYSPVVDIWVFLSVPPSRIHGILLMCVQLVSNLLAHD